MRCQRLSPARVQWRPSAARGSSAALGRSVGLRPAGGARVSGAGLMIDRPAPETKSGAGAVAALGRQGELGSTGAQCRSPAGRGRPRVGRRVND